MQKRKYEKTQTEYILCDNNLTWLVSRERSKLTLVLGRSLKIDDTEQIIADACGMSKGMIKQIKKKLTNPSLPNAIKLANYFNCKVEDIFCLPDEN